MRAFSICSALFALLLILFPAGFSLASSTTPTSSPSSFKILPENQQLIQSSVKSIIQDDKGFLWIGTLGGLQRFDGQKMILINELALDGSFLDVIRINTLAKGTDGNIWVGGAYGALDLIRTEEGLVEHYSDLTQGNGEFDLGTISKIHPMPDGNVLVGNGFSVFRIDQTNHSIDKLPIHWPEYFQDSRIRDFLLMDNGKLLFSNIKQAGVLDLNTGQVKHLFLDNHELDGDFILHGIKRLKDGSIWAFGNNSALYQLVTNARTINFQAISLPTEENFDFIDLAMDLGGVFWFNLRDKGIATWNSISDKLLFYDLGFNKTYNNQSSFFNSIFIDRSGVIWIGTEGYGLRFLAPSRDRFFHLRGRESSQFGCAGSYIWQIVEDSEGIAVMGQRELFRFDPISGQTQHILDISTHPDMVGLPALSTFAPVSEGKWLLGFGNKMLGYFNQKQNSFRPLTQFMDLWEDPETQPSCRRLERDKKGQVWIFTTEGTWVFAPATNEITVPSTKLNLALIDSEVRVMFESRDGTLWFGTEHSGLVHYDPHHDIIEEWKDFSKPGNLAYPGVRAIYEDDDGDIWIGTYNGLNVLRAEERNRGGRYLELFTTQDGLPNNTIYSILPGPNDELWFATNLGLCRFREKSGTWKNYDRLDGLANDEFNGGAQLLSSSGHLLFGGKEGLTWFKPGEQKENLVAPLVSLTRIFNKGADYNNPLSVPSLKYISLPWDCNRLEIELASLDFQQPRDHQVAYRIDGVDEQWWHALAGQHIHLASLPSGTMTLHYCAINNDGVWSEPGELIIEVGSPPWRTNQALLFYVLVVISLSGILVEMTRRKRLQKEEIKQQMIISDKLRSMGLLSGGLAHDFGNFLQVMLAHSDLARRRIPAGHPAEMPLDKLLLAGEKAQQMVGKMLSFVRDDEQTLKVIDLDMVVLSIQPLLESLVNKEVDLEIDYGPDGKFFMGNDEQIEQILTNLCINARDAIDGPGNIIIRTQHMVKSGSQEWCQLSVIDDGKGMSPQDISRIFEPFFSTKGAGKGTGMGLAIAFNIVEAHEGKISVTSTLGQGTAFDVLFPRIQSLESNKP